MTAHREPHEVAWELAQTARAEFNAKVGVINEHYRGLKRQRAAEHDQGFNALRERAVMLRHARPRDVQALALVETEMRGWSAKPAPKFDDLEAARLAEIACEDGLLAQALADIRRRLRAGELIDNGCHV